MVLKGLAGIPVVDFFFPVIRDVPVPHDGEHCGTGNLINYNRPEDLSVPKSKASLLCQFSGFIGFRRKVK